VRHHLDVLTDNDLVRSSGDDYGAVYLPTASVKDNWDTVETISDKLDQ
jgi:hypothetical protein